MVDQQPTAPQVNTASSCDEVVVPVPLVDDDMKAQEEETQFQGCFVTSIFGLSPGQIDRPTDATTLRQQYPGFDFILFTNLAEIEAPGWRKVLYFHPNLNRFITQSRYGKFVAWKQPVVTDRCPFVVYMDGLFVPKEPKDVFLELGQAVRNSTVGLMQRKHARPGGIRREMQVILRAQKDTAENMQITKDFLDSRPDMNWDCQMYTNTYFVYDPTNTAFRTVTAALWEILTNEHGSWRDQPYWCYTLDRYQFQPIDFPTDNDYVRPVWRNMKGRLGKAHVYDNTTNAEVELYIESLNTTRCGMVHALSGMAGSFAATE